MRALLSSPVVRDALVVFGVWLAFRLLRTSFSLREILVAAILVGLLHLGASGVLQHGAAGPYVMQFVDLCTPYADPERCRCARVELERSMREREFAELAFKFYVDRMPPPKLREALSGCS
jgi:hypothetical protein